LSSQKSTQNEIEKMHLKHSKAMVEDAGISAPSGSDSSISVEMNKGEAR
jgi:hypothetical protein